MGVYRESGNKLCKAPTAYHQRYAWARVWPGPWALVLTKVRPGPWVLTRVQPGPWALAGGEGHSGNHKIRLVFLKIR